MVFDSSLNEAEDSTGDDPRSTHGIHGSLLTGFSAETRISDFGDPKRHTPIERLLERLEPHGFRCAGFYIGAIAADRGVHHGDVLMVRADRLPAGMYWSPSDVLDGHPCPFKD